MHLLLDIHLLLQALAEPDGLDATTRVALEDPNNEVLLNAVSLWKIAIRAKLGRSNFAFVLQQILRAASCPCDRRPRCWWRTCRCIIGIPLTVCCGSGNQ
jgi:PIN domain nuclease of toxin-antitoxin system